MFAFSAKIQRGCSFLKEHPQGTTRAGSSPVMNSHNHFKRTTISNGISSRRTAKQQINRGVFKTKSKHHHHPLSANEGSFQMSHICSDGYANTTNGQYSHQKARRQLAPHHLQTPQKNAFYRPHIGGSHSNDDSLPTTHFFIIFYLLYTFPYQVSQAFRYCFVEFRGVWSIKLLRQFLNSYFISFVE